MTTTLQHPAVAAALERMYAESNQQWRQRDSGRVDWARLENATAQERADALADVYMPVSPDAGRLLYSLVRATRPATVVEFGMSLGISAIHLAAAIRDNGAGQVITTELSAAKIARAKTTFDEVGVADVITVLEGDALTTLTGVDAPVGMVLLDGWKELYVPVIELLEPKLSPGALIVADNTEQPGTKPYVDYVRDPENGYVSVNFPGKERDSMEISCWVGAEP